MFYVTLLPSKLEHYRLYIYFKEEIKVYNVILVWLLTNIDVKFLMNIAGKIVAGNI